VKLVTSEKNVLIDDLAKNLENNENIYELMFSLLIVGKPIHFTIMNSDIERCHMYGYISCNSAGYATVSNKIFEILMTGYLASRETPSYLNIKNRKETQPRTKCWVPSGFSVIGVSLRIFQTVN